VIDIENFNIPSD